MTDNSYVNDPKLAEIAFFVVLAVLLVTLHQIAVPVFVVLLLFSVVVAFYRPVVFIYFLAASTLFSPELPVAGGISPNVILMFGFVLAVLGRMAVSGTWVLPHSRYATLVILFGIIGIVSLLKSFMYFDVQTVVAGGLYLVQWLSYLSLPVLMAFYIQNNDRHIIGVLSFTLFVSAVMALYLLGLFVFDIRPIETTVRLAGHRPLVAFWQQGNLAVGMFTALTSLVAFGITVKESRTRVAGSLLALSVLCGFLTLATVARSAILGLAIGFLVVMSVEYRWKTLLTVMIAAPVGILLAPEWLVIRFTRSTFFWREVPALGVEIPIGTLWKRVNGWVQLSEVFIHNPVFGIGFSLSQERMAQLLATRISPDNHYVALLMETGILGFAVFCMWVRMIFWRLFEAYKRETIVSSGLALGMIGAFVTLLVWAFFQGFYARWRVLGPLFIYIGLIYAANERSPIDAQS